MKFLALAFVMTAWIELWLPAAQAESNCRKQQSPCQKAVVSSVNTGSVKMRSIANSGTTQAQRYALGIHKFRLNRKDAITGWQLSDRWYFGRQRGAVNNFGLIRQQRQMLISIGKEGVGFSMRF